MSALCTGIQLFKNMKEIWAIGDSHTHGNMGVAVSSADFKISSEEEKILTFTKSYPVPHS